MKNNFKTLAFLCLLLINGTNLFAQELLDELKGKMDSIFYYVDRNRVETGILSDYGYHTVDPCAFNGLPSDTNYVDMDIWKYLYLGMYTSQFNSKSNLETPKIFCSKIDASSSLAVMCLRYNKLDDEAVNKGMLRVENEQIREIAGTTSPYLLKTLFAVAPKQSKFDSNNVSFKFDRELCVTNLSNNSIQKIEVDFNGESGYRSATWGVPISYSFQSSGDKIIRFRFLLTDGTTLVSRTKIKVEGSKRKSVSPLKINEYVIPKMNGHAGGKVQYAYGEFNKTGNFIRPLIIVEDADMGALISGGELDLKVLMEDNAANQMIEKLHLLYDIVYIDYQNGVDDIFHNAKFFEAAMDTVNSHKSSTFDANYIIGMGMGGLVAKYGLSSMEKRGKTHYVDKFISLNSPHKGANFPLSLQAAMRYGYNLDNSFSLGSMSLESVINLLNSTAMKQMLVYSMDEKLELTNDHTIFQQEYEAMGFPKQCRNVAVSSGSYNGNSLFSGGSTLLEFEGDESVLGPLEDFILRFMFFSGVDAEIKINAKALSNKSVMRYFEGKIRVHITILALIHIWQTKNKVALNSTPDMCAVDGAPGSYISLSNMLGKDNSSILQQGNFCFVPTASALGINDWENKLLLPLSLNSISSNFNRLYATEGNNGYENLAACKDALLEELASHIEGQTKDNIMSDTEFELTNIPALTIMGIPVPLQSVISWEFSDTNFKVVSSTDNKVVVRPLNFNKQSTLYACLDLSKVGGGKLRVDSIQISSGECKLLGERVLHLNGSRFELSFVPEDATVEWSYSAGIEEKEKGRDYIVLGGSGNSILLWVEAEMKLGDDTQTFYADLTCEPLPEILGVEIDKTRWDRGNGEVWYLLKLKHDPCLKNFETITWKADSLSAGGKAATLYSGLFKPMIFPFATKQSAGDINFPPLKPILPDEPDLTKPWYQRGTGHGEVAIAFDPSCTDTKVTFELNVGGRVQTITRIVSPNGTIRTQNCPQQLKIKAVDAYVSNSGGVWFLLRADYDLMNTATVSFDWNEEYPFVFGLGSLTRDIPNTGSLPFNASGLGGGFEPGQDFGLPWYMKSPNYNEIFLFFRRGLKTSDLTVVNCKMQTDCGVLTASLKVASPIKYNIYDIFPNPVKTNLSVRKIENETEITTKTDSEANADPEIVTLSLFGLSMPEEPEAITIQLYSEYGLVRTLENVILNPDAQMNVADLPNGTYYLNIIKDGEVIDRRVVLIEH